VNQKISSETDKVANGKPDLLKIPDADAFAYQQELKKLASSLGLTHLVFVRPGTLAGIATEEAKTLEEYSHHVSKTRNLLDGTLAQAVDPSEDENVQATSKHYDTALPQTEDPEALKAAMLKRGKVGPSSTLHFVLCC
jgi:hypothetical protein